MSCILLALLFFKLPWVVKVVIIIIIIIIIVIIAVISFHVATIINSAIFVLCVSLVLSNYLSF